MSDYRVALISHEFPPFLIGGMASHCYDLAYNLSRNKIFTTVFCGMSNKKVVEKLNSYLEIVRLPFLNLPPRFLWFQAQNFRFLLKALQEFDIIHFVNPLASAFFSLFTKKLTKKVLITTVHEVFLSNLKVFFSAPFSEWTLGDLRIHGVSYPINEFSLRTCLVNADHVIVCGYSALQEMKRIYPDLNYEKVSVIYNGIDLERFNDIYNQFSVEDFSVIYYGRLVWIKGVLYLLRALSYIRNHFPDLNIKIVGKGPLERKIKILIRKLDLKNVYMYGYLDHTKLIQEVVKNSLVVLPSLYEVGPFISGLEAMACRKTLISFDFPFTREFISHMHNGILVEARNVNDLAAKIRLALMDSKLRRRIGQNAYQYVKQKHNWKLIVKRYIDVYENCLHK